MRRLVPTVDGAQVDVEVTRAAPAVKAPVSGISRLAVPIAP